jgi:hypothetical protein
MAKIEVELTDSEVAQLEDAANGRGTTRGDLAARWIRERLVHERERAAGGGRPMSPRARREEQSHG